MYLPKTEGIGDYVNIIRPYNSTLCNEGEICLFLRWGKFFQDETETSFENTSRTVEMISPESHTILFLTSPMISVFLLFTFVPNIFLSFCIHWVCLRPLLLALIKNSGLRSGRLCACIVTWQIKIWCLREILICLLELECT